MLTSVPSHEPPILWLTIVPQPSVRDRHPVSQDTRARAPAYKASPSDRPPAQLLTPRPPAVRAQSRDSGDEDSIALHLSPVRRDRRRPSEQEPVVPGLPARMMENLPEPAVDPEEGAFVENGASTAPTTPEGSLSFSPVLRAAADGPLDIESTSLAAQALNTRSLSSALFDMSLRQVQNICCVGAGYVGELAPSDW